MPIWRRWVVWKYVTHTHMLRKGSLPGTSQQCAAKWDVWEPPAAKRRTGRGENKPSLMETWHARWAGNSNKRLMGHGAFSAVAKYAPLHPDTPPHPQQNPPSLFTLALSHVGHLKTEDSTPATHFCKSLSPTELRLMGIRVRGESSKTDLGFK